MLLKEELIPYATSSPGAEAGKKTNIYMKWLSCVPPMVARKVA